MAQVRISRAGDCTWRAMSAETNENARADHGTDHQHGGVEEAEARDQTGRFHCLAVSSHSSIRARNVEKLQVSADIMNHGYGVRPPRRSTSGALSRVMPPIATRSRLACFFTS